MNRSNALNFCAALATWYVSTVLLPVATAATSSSDNWSTHNGSPDETAYSSADSINTSTVKRLGLLWSLDLPGERSLQATPLAVNGILYFTGSYSAIYAVDALRGALRWKYDPQVWQRDPAKLRYTLPVNRGVAYAQGRIFSGTLDGRLLALDARTGKLLWSVAAVPPNSMQTITGAPRTFRGKVIIGSGGSDFGVRGQVIAFDAHDGRERWRFYTAPGTPDENAGHPEMQRAAATWSGEFWKSGIGGAVWDNITFDQKLGRIYLGTGNGPYNSGIRGTEHPDHLFIASIIALDADSGKYLWHYQTTPRDNWDFDATQQMVLADLTIDGKIRSVLMQAPKNGFFYVLDRRDGALISAEKIGKVNWAERVDLATGRPVETGIAHYEGESTEIWPGPLGAHSIQTMSYSAQTGLVYIPYMQLGVRYLRNASDSDGITFGDLSFEALQGDPADGKSTLLAWDPVRQKARWKAPLPTLWNGGVLSTGGGLVFQGTADGRLSAYAAAGGQQLWQFDAKLGINAPPITFRLGGKQYVSVLVGYGGSAAIWGMNVGWKFAAQPRRLLTFALDANAALPATAGPDMSVNALDDASLVLNEADVHAGHALYIMCAACHGLNLVATGAPGPDLRESALALHRETLSSVLHDGTLLPGGMPRFETLSEEQVKQLHAYIRAGARRALQSGSK